MCMYRESVCERELVTERVFVVTACWRRDRAQGCCLDLCHCNSHIIVDNSESMGSRGFSLVWVFHVNIQCHLIL